VRKKAIARVLLSLPGFRVSGPFYIGVCNREVISGYVLDAPPGEISIWRFIVPAYDKLEFLHMSLGSRVVQFALDENAPVTTELGLQLKNDWQSFSSTQDCRTLLTYLDQERVEGDYCRWTRYLTHVKIGDFDSANRLESQLQSSSEPPRVQLVAQNIRPVLEAKQHTGWNGVQRLLSEWSDQTIARFCQ
jgi:hypothetical protein